MCVFKVFPLPNMLRADSQCFASGSEFELQITVTQFPVVIYTFDLVVDSEDKHGHATQQGGRSCAEKFGLGKKC